MKVIIDDKIPYIRGVFEPFGEVVYLSGSKTTPEVVCDADAIITRTRTICNEALLMGSTVKFIATATIGYDHIDTDYCERKGIAWTNAPGCNSKSVEQYIASALMVLAQKNELTLRGKTIGVVGVGQVGSKVAKICNLFGMKVLLYDPPRERAEGSNAFTSLQTIQEQADFVTLHVPLNLSGADATFHLVDEAFFNALKRKPFMFNTCRGEVMETQAAKTAICQGLVSGLVVDCWENEPNLDLELFELVDLATPHIAGYSKDGKANGTTMCVQAISRFFGLGIDDWFASGVEQPDPCVLELNGTSKSDEAILSEAILATYDLRRDHAALRVDTSQFEKLRGDYPLRREFPAYNLQLKQVPERVAETLKLMGFRILKKE
jgi:erythronate-4-phosphate dehydrogenase